jgi:hypothetical protein
MDPASRLGRTRGMKTFALLLCLAAFAAAPAASAAGGPPQYASQGGLGVSTPNGNVHYVAVPGLGGPTTLIESIGSDGSVRNWPSFKGSWGIPMITYSNPTGLSHDGRTLVVQSLASGSPTSFLVIDTRTMRLRDQFTLRGNYSFDALSPDASRLYLIQRVDANNYSRYIVRAYDMKTRTLLPGRIADRTQKSWVMQGDAVSRTTSLGGRWVYTFYTNYGGTPFIHALDTVKGVAHCIGIPWAKADQSGLYNIVLTLHGQQLAVHWRSGKRWLNVDASTWRISPAAGPAFPWRWIGIGAGLVAAAGALLLLARRRRISLRDGTLLARAA